MLHPNRHYSYGRAVSDWQLNRSLWCPRAGQAWQHHLQALR